MTADETKHRERSSEAGMEPGKDPIRDVEEKNSACAFLRMVGANYDPAPQENVMKSLSSEYKRVILESLITSFGLDSILFRDQHGGDVDTIHNVRQVGQDPQMAYKDPRNRQAYEDKPLYDFDSYHGGHPAFRAAKGTFDAQHKAGTLLDAYTVEPIEPGDRYHVDHILSAKSIDDDRGRLLAGLNGPDLANSPENLAPTNASLNCALGQYDMDTFWAKAPQRQAAIERLEAIPDRSPAQQQALDKLKAYEKADEPRMRQLEVQARKAYENKLARAYYSSPEFLNDTASAMGDTAVRMGLRQAVGFVFTEVVLSVMDEFDHIPEPFSMEELLTRLARGLQQGFQRALEKYKTVLDRLGGGAVSGALASLSTTICNIFFTTAKNTVSLIRQMWASLVRAAEILLINPDDYSFGVRMRMIVTVLATGASVVAGTLVQEAISNTPVGSIPHLGNVIEAFCGTLVSGLLSTSFLYYLDYSPKIRELTAKLDNVYTIDAEVGFFRREAAYFEQLAAQTESIDIDAFRKEVQLYSDCADILQAADSEKALNVQLKTILQRLGVALPWGEGSFDDFMRDKSRHLVIG